MTPDERPGPGARLYRQFLALLPYELRSEFGDEMLAVFRQRLAEAPTRSKRATILALGLGDVVRQAVEVRWSEFAAPSVASSFAALGADVRLSLRRLIKDPTTSLAAVISLALAVGACTSAFRLVDGLLFRPLPVESPHELYSLSYRTEVPNLPEEGWDSGPYIMFRGIAEAVRSDATVFAVSRTYRMSVRLDGSDERESANIQRVSGETFTTLGLVPAVGRLFTPADDLIPGDHPVAVISDDYWSRRFGRSRSVVGAPLEIGDVQFQIVGVVDGPFSGVETGRMTDVFIPTMMGRNVMSAFQNGLVGYLRIHDDVDRAALSERIRSAWLSFQETRTATIEAWTPEYRRQFLTETEIVLSSASAGSSAVQREFRRPLAVLSVLVALVLLIAAVNVANLLIVRAGRRRVDSAVRVSIGAGRARVIQLALVESAWIAFTATALGLLLSAWAVPQVLETLGETGDPVRLLLPFDIRLAGFALGLALAATTFFGLAPAWRAAQVQPIHALKVGSAGALRRRTPHALIAIQAGFCFVVLFVAGLFVSTSRGLSELPTGFETEGILALSVEARPPADMEAWNTVAAALAMTPGVEGVALSGWALLDGSSTNGAIAYAGGEPDRDILTEFLCVSEGWIDVMGIQLLEGRDFRSSDRYPDVVLVNEAFVRTYADNTSPLDRTFERAGLFGERTPSRIVGVVEDVRYLDLRGSPPPTAYIPCASADQDGVAARRGFGALMVRSRTGDPEGLIPELREAVNQAGSGFAFVRARTQEQINRRHTVRERLLASLGGFFGLVALLLAGVGLYGVLHDSVQQRQRELSVRIALGARGRGIVREVIVRSGRWLVLGLAMGLAVAPAADRLVQSLLFGSVGLSFAALALPSLIVLSAGVVAAAPGAVRALRTNPAQALRAE